MYVFLTILLGITFMSHGISKDWHALAEPDYSKKEQFNEILVQYIRGIPELYNDLVPAERVIVYYLYRASIPAGVIYADQIHRLSLPLMNIFRTILAHKKAVAGELQNEFIRQAQTYFVYLIANNGPYFKREFPHKKRVPASLGLAELTKQNLIKALEIAGVPTAQEDVEAVWPFLSDAQIDPVLTVTGDINASAINIYSPDFTQDDYTDLAQKGAANNYYVIENGIRRSGCYKIGDRYGKELAVSAFWFEKALEHARQNPGHFDIYFVESIEHLVQFLTSGDEESYKNYWRAWLKTKSRITYTFGFIETYDDPMEKTGSMSGEVTITKVSLAALSSILPSIERSMPLPPNINEQTPIHCLTRLLIFNCLAPAIMAPSS